MPSLKFSVVDSFDDLRASGLARPAAEKFAGAWLACFLVMARGNIFAAFTLEHAQLASVCGIVGALVTVALLVQMTGRLTASPGKRRSARSRRSSAISSRTRRTFRRNGRSRW